MPKKQLYLKYQGRPYHKDRSNTKDVKILENQIFTVLKVTFEFQKEALPLLLLGLIAPNPRRKFLKYWTPNSWDKYQVSEQGLMRQKHQENSSKRRKNNFICALYVLLLNLYWYQKARERKVQFHYSYIHSNPSRSVNKMNKEATNEMPVLPWE